MSCGLITASADSILRLNRVPAAGYELRLILSSDWIEFWLLDTSCGWSYPTDDSSSSGWIRVAVYSILRLTRVPAVGCKLRVIPSHGWLEFLQLDRSCGWFYHTTDLSSSGWIRVATDSILRLFRVSAAGYELWVTLSCGWLESWRLDTRFHPDSVLQLAIYLFIILFIIYFIY